MESAQAKLDQLLATPLPEDVAVAEAAVRQAEEQLKLKQQPTSDADLEAQRQAVAQAQAQLALKLQPATAMSVEEQRQAVVQAQAQAALKQQPYTAPDLDAAVAAVDQARGQVVTAEYNLDTAVLVAPFAGIINQVGLNTGELATGAATVGGGSIMLVDPDALRIDVNIDESDILRVQIGQPVQLTVDALGGRPARGRVTAVAPQSTTTQGVTSYVVSVAVDGGQGLRPGMTATANIVYAQQGGVLLVPNRALRRQGREQVVDVLTPEGKVEPRTIRRGISNDQTTEITEGLNEGDQVVLPTTQTRAPTVGGGPGGGFGGGPGGIPIR
jgi:HlyD family secretion protein